MSNFIRNNEVETAMIGDELGMLDVHLGRYFILDGISTDVWSFFKNTHTKEELIEYLIGQYEVNRETCNKDVTTLLQDMISKKIILEV